MLLFCDVTSTQSAAATVPRDRTHGAPSMITAGMARVRGGGPPAVVPVAVPLP